MKTHQAMAKRFKITKNKKVIHRHCGQDHFNAREEGGKTRNKRKDHIMSAAHAKLIARMTSK